ncbi:hypothetical protein CIG19_19770 [Enterobacterales bacterium CwR94]|nr:hypothetical protein CIG19_19770 [Enterobacterales bacterium CwR94]
MASRLLLFILPVLLSACTIDPPERSVQENKEAIWMGKQQDSRRNVDGSWQVDRRMDRIRAQGRIDNSADGGTRIGW